MIFLRDLVQLNDNDRRIIIDETQTIRHSRVLLLDISASGSINRIARE